MFAPPMSCAPPLSPPPPPPLLLLLLLLLLMRRQVRLFSLCLSRKQKQILRAHKLSHANFFSFQEGKKDEQRKPLVFLRSSSIRRHTFKRFQMLGCGLRVRVAANSAKKTTCSPPLAALATDVKKRKETRARVWIKNATIMSACVCRQQENVAHLIAAAKEKMSRARQKAASRLTSDEARARIRAPDV